jgi:hypothetical protein
MKRLLGDRTSSRRRPGTGDEYHGQMSSADHQEDFEQEFGPLERRLRDMKWPDVEPGMRERCWRDFKRIAAEGGLGSPGADTPGDEA